jgi:hypothetical protein
MASKIGFNMRIKASFAIGAYSDLSWDWNPDGWIVYDYDRGSYSFRKSSVMPNHAKLH